MIGSPAWRQAVSDGAMGKVIASLEWSAGEDGEDGYWVMTFTDGTEICFDRTMAEREALPTDDAPTPP